MIEEKQPSYYSIIPSTVRYDKRLKFAERLLYGEITALMGKEGYCFASNNYFASLYEVIPGTISRWISHLAKLGYITVEVIRNDKNEVIERRIYITDISCRKVMQNTYEQNSIYLYKHSRADPMSQKAKENNINIKIDRFFNYIMNNKGKLPKDFISIEQFQEFYEIIERFELNYTEDILNTFQEDNIVKLKILIYTMKEIFTRKRKELLVKATREDFIEVYGSCKKFENLYKNTESEIKNFFDYYYASVIRKLEAKQ